MEQNSFDKRDNFEKFGTSNFFQFFESHGVSWFFADGMPRRKTGERGAPIGAQFGFKFAFHTSNLVAAFRRFDLTMAKHNRLRVDLQTRQSPDIRIGSRVVFLDDLGEHRIDDLQRWWTGPMAIIATSQMNFQALLISPRGLSDNEKLRCQSSAVFLFETDPGATSARQLHRFPGSPNYKTSALVNGTPFICRTLCLVDGDGDGVKQIDELLYSGIVNAPKPIKFSAEKCPKIREDGRGNNERAMSWTLAQLRIGASEEVILGGLSTVYLSHHSPTDWPRRTLHNARHYLGMESARYRAK